VWHSCNGTNTRRKRDTIMPTYEYRCDDDKTLTALQRSVDERDDLVECSQCGREMRREFHAVPVKFNATGFYSTGG
jgi:putative FmdB family regulatory protein